MIRCPCLWILVYLTVVLSVNVCRQRDQCSCVLDTGETIDLHRIPSKTVARFRDVRGSDGFLYTYNPCTPFSCIPPRNDSYLCRSDLMHHDRRCLGNVSGIVTMETRSSGVSIHYLTQDTHGNISSIVYLKCDPIHPDRFVVKKTQSRLLTADYEVSDYFEFELYSPCACLDGCVQAPPGLSPGSIMLLIFFSLVSLYFGVGCVYNKAVNGSNGSELIPQSAFWRSLPGLIKDGYFFFISPCLGNRIEYHYYDKL